MPKKMTPMLSALAGIRDEIRLLRAETRSEIGQLREEIGQLREETRSNQKEMEIRIASELVAVAGAVREVRDAVLGQHAVSSRVDDHERRIAALERRTG